METLFIYLLKVNISISVFYILYMLLFRKDTFLKLRRWYFLSAVAFSFLCPFFVVDGLSNVFTFKTEPKEEVTAMVFIGEPIAAQIIEDETPGFFETIPWKEVAIYTYLAITVFLAIRFLWQLISILYIRAKSKKRNIYGTNVYHLSGKVTPFSFFSWIFINTLTHTDEEIKQILYHEKTHARQLHSVDVLLMELLCVAFWCNPFVWLMKREQAMNLEYLADNDVLQHGINSREYQYHLLRLTYQKTAVQIVNNFNVSQLKQRIMMMNKTKSPVRTLTKYFAILPMLLLLITANSAFAQKVEPQKKVEQKKATQQKVDEVFVTVEEAPTFPGGTAGLVDFLNENIKYPEDAQKRGKEGRVIVQFIVEKDGSLSDINIVRSADPLFDAEAVRVVKSMPIWNPGKQRGQEVRVRYTLPVLFKLDADGKRVVLKAASDENKEQIVDEVFVVVEEAPVFPGGDSALMKFLNDNIKYPDEAQKRGAEGRVTCQFVVEKDGSLSEVKVLRSADPLLDAEAVRVIESMPKWKPGKQKGKEVRVRYTLPVLFKLSSDKKENSIEEVFMVVEEVPAFPGGESALMKFLNDNIEYPAEAYKNGIQGRVNCTFVVEKDGSLSDIKVLTGVHPLLDAEAVRVIKSMPKWKPGKQKGHLVRVQYTLPVLFRLQS